MLNSGQVQVKVQVQVRVRVRVRVSQGQGQGPGLGLGPGPGQAGQVKSGHHVRSGLIQPGGKEGSEDGKEGGGEGERGVVKVWVQNKNVTTKRPKQTTCEVRALQSGGGGLS